MPTPTRAQCKETVSTQPKETAQERAKRLCAVWQGLPKSEQIQLRDAARARTPPIFWDRLENPHSPISVNLWELLETRDNEKPAD